MSQAAGDPYRAAYTTLIAGLITEAFPPTSTYRFSGFDQFSDHNRNQAMHALASSIDRLAAALEALQPPSE